MTQHTLFISHISEEGRLAEALKTHIEADFGGVFDVFVSSDLVSIDAGQAWLGAIEQALQRACVELVLCSASSVGKPWINFEAGAAWIRGIAVVPVCHSGLLPAQLPMPYSTLQAITLGDPLSVRRLYALLAKKAGMPPAQTPAPGEELLAKLAQHEGSSAARRPNGKPFVPHVLDDPWGMHVGDVWIPWVVAAYGPYRADNIVSHFHPTEPAYPEDVEQIFARTTADIAAREARGDDVPYDSQDFKLARFHVSSRTSQLEEPKLVLHFAPTTYFRMLSTDQHLDVSETLGGRTYTLREKYAAKVDLRARPVPEFATHWGVGLGVITADNYLLISERGNTAVDAHVFFPSVAEGATRARDSSGNGAPDHFSIACRGMQEELGIELRQDELTWLSFGANAVLCEYALIGRVNTSYTSEQIRKRRAQGMAKDSWESAAVHSVPFDPAEVARFCSDRTRRFSPFALVTIFHCLINEFGVEDVERHFRGKTVRVTQKLPDWLVDS